MSAAAFSAGIPLEKQVDLLVTMSQALAGLKIPTAQLLQESRALLTGVIDNNSMAAKMLQITPEDIRRAKDAGELFEFLMGKMASFAEAGKLASRSFAGALSAMMDQFNITAGELTKPIFETLKSNFLSFTEELKKPAVEASLRGIINRLNSILQASFDLGTKAVQNINALTTAFEALAIASSLALGSALISGFNRLAAVAFGGALVGLKDWIAALKLLPALLRSITTIRVVTWLGAITTALMLGKEAWAAWKAAKQDALSSEGVKENNAALAASIAKAIDSGEKDGSLTIERAKELRALLQSIVEDAGRVGQALTNNLLVSTAKMIIPQCDESESAAKAKEKSAEEIKRSREFANAKAEAQVKINLAALSLEERQLKDSYDRRLLSIEQFAEKLREGARQRAAEESRLATRGLTAVDGSGSPDMVARQQAAAEIAAIQIKLKEDLLTIAADERKGRLQEDAEFASARIALAEASGNERIAIELRIRQKFAELKSAFPAEEEEIFFSEQAALAQARVADQIERQSKAQTVYQQALQTTNAALQSGQITQREAHEQNNLAAREYLDVLKFQLVTLENIAKSNPDLDGLLEIIRAIKAEIKTIVPERDPNNFGEQIGYSFEQAQAQIGTMAESAGRAFAAPFLAAVSEISKGIEGLITGTMDWGDALKSVSTGIMRSVVNAFSNMVAEWMVGLAMMGIKWVATHLIMKAASVAFNAARTVAHTIAETTMTVVTEVNSAARGKSALIEGIKWLWQAAVKGASSVADIPYVGWALAIAAIGSILAVGMGAMGGFREGGYTGSGASNEPAGVVHKDEFVMPSSHRSIFPLLERIRTGAAGAQELGSNFGNGIARPITSDENARAMLPGLSGAGSSTPNVNVAGHSMKVMMVGMTERDVRKIIEEELPDKIVDISRQRRRDIGIET